MARQMAIGSLGYGGDDFLVEEQEWLVRDRVSQSRPDPKRSRGGSMPQGYDVNQMVNPDYGVPMIYQDGGLWPANVFAPKKRTTIPREGMTMMSTGKGVRGVAQPSNSFVQRSVQGPIDPNGAPADAYNGVMLNDHQHQCLMQQISSKEECYVRRCPRTGAFIPHDCPPPGCELLWLALSKRFNCDCESLIEYYIVNRADYICGARMMQEQVIQASRPGMQHMMPQMPSQKVSKPKKNPFKPQDDGKTNWWKTGAIIGGGLFIAKVLFS